MTVIAIWPEDSTFLFAVADTRVGIPTESGGHVLRTDRASKLLPLTVNCWTVPNGNISRMPLSTASYGFAFSGDCLPALMTYAAANACLGNLQSISNSRPPTLRAIAEFVRGLAEQYFSELWRNHMGKGGFFELAIFGWCSNLNSHRVFQIRHDTSEQNSKMVMEEAKLGDQRTPVVFGSGSASLLGEIQRIANDGDPFCRTMRLPKIALENMVRDQTHVSVGGSIQIGVATAQRFQLMQYCHPIEMGKAAAVIEFLGFDLFQGLGVIDGYMPGMTALA